MVIDCAEIGKSKSDAALVSSLAEQTGGSLFDSTADFRVLPRILLPFLTERVDRPGFSRIDWSKG